MENGWHQGHGNARKTMSKCKQMIKTHIISKGGGGLTTMFKSSALLSLFIQISQGAETQAIGRALPG